MKDNYSPKICCVGLGPAGIGTAYTISQHCMGKNALFVDAGVPIRNRRCNLLEGGHCLAENPCQIIGGVGGCSVISNGKISGYPAGKSLASILGSTAIARERLVESLRLLRNFIVLEEPNIRDNTLKNARKKFEELGFEYRFYPVYTFNPEQLVSAYQSLLSEIELGGTSVLLNTRITHVDTDGCFFKLAAVQNNRKITISTKFLVLAVGRLGQDLLESLVEKIDLKSKQYHLDLGVRLEFPTELYPDIDEFHKDLKLLFKGARTFCLCKDGKIAPYRYENIFLLEGHYNPLHGTGFTNLAITIRLKPSLQNKKIFNETKKRVLGLSGGRPVRQMLPKYLDATRCIGTTSRYSDSSISFWQWGNVNQCFAEEISSRIRTAVGYFAEKLLPRDQWWKVSVFAPEADLRMRFPISADLSIAPKLFLIGDCTGRFRGILQAFCSGLICGENIIGCIENERRE